MSLQHILALGACASLASGAGSATPPVGARAVTVRIVRVAQIDNLDKMDIDPDRADFYALVSIDGHKFQRTKNFSFDDGRPNWTFTGSARGRYVRLWIKLCDDDGGLEEADDFVDINPRKGKKDLNFTLDTRTGRITGDVRGRRGRTIYSYGEGDTDQGKIWFTVR